MKIAADDREGDRGRGERYVRVLRATTQVLDAKTSATTVGMHDWKTIAPVMLPIASVGLPLADPDHRIELLGQLGRDRGDDQREQDAVDVELAVPDGRWL